MTDAAAPEFRLDGVTTLVTGASGGLGLHFARVLHDAGARVALAARRLDRLEAEAARLGARAAAIALDVTDTDAIAPAFDAAEAALGPITLLVNNAGIGATRPMLDITPEEWDQTMDVDLRAAFFVAQEAARRMKDAGGRSIINITSIAATCSRAGLSSYATAKAGLAHLTRGMAIELARHNIRVNALAPGYVITDINRAHFTPDVIQSTIKDIPQRRLGQLEDLTGPLLLLASPAGAHMTGTVLVVDGGHSINAL
jgi:NAD(P)-dependent dehydrogenase (short-subunit alcohol dehydrogenase family)